MKRKIFAVIVFLMMGLFLIGCTEEVSLEEVNNPTEDVEEAEIKEVTTTPEPTLEATLTPTPEPTSEPTFTPTPEPTLTETQVSTPTEDWGERYWSPDEALLFLWDRDALFIQFFWDPELPVEEDPLIPTFPVTMEMAVNPPEGFTDEDFDNLLVEYARELSKVPADYICDKTFTWMVMGYGWPKDPQANERFDTEMMLDNGVYYHAASDGISEPYCVEFSPDNRENTLKMIEEWENKTP